MAGSYKKLRKMLIVKDMKKENLRLATGIATTAMAKFGRNEDANTSVLLKICSALRNISDIMEIVSIEKYRRVAYGKDERTNSV